MYKPSATAFFIQPHGFEIYPCCQFTQIANSVNLIAVVVSFHDFTIFDLSIFLLTDCFQFLVLISSVAMNILVSVSLPPAWEFSRAYTWKWSCWGCRENWLSSFPRHCQTVAMPTGCPNFPFPSREWAVLWLHTLSNTHYLVGFFICQREINIYSHAS